MNDPELIKTAYHEAGHATACLYYNIEFDTVSINAEDDKLGGIKGRSNLPNPENSSYDDNLKLWKYMIMWLAGHYAVKKYSGKGDEVGARFDIEEVGEILFEIAGSDKQAKTLYDYLNICSEELFEIDGRDTPNWAICEKISNALLEKRILTYEECLSLKVSPH